MGPKKIPSAAESQVDYDKKFKEQTERLNNLEKRLVKTETSVKAMEKSLNIINAQITDLKRQNVKQCIAFSGRDVPKWIPGEDATAIFIQLARKKYGVRVAKDDLAVVHRRGNGQLVAKFNNFHEGSGYYRLVVRRGKGSMNPNPKLHVFANVLLTPMDAKIRFYVSIAKRVGTILFYEQLLSGRIGIVVPITAGSDETKKIAINEFEDLKPYLSEEVLKEIETANKKRKEARKSKKKELNSQQVDELLRSETEQEDEDDAPGMDVS